MHDEYTVEQWQHAGYTCRIVLDVDPPFDPREDYDHLGTMMYAERRGWYAHDEYRDNSAPNARYYDLQETCQEIARTPGTVSMALHAFSYGPRASDEPYNPETHIGLIWIDRDDIRKHFPAWEIITRKRRASLIDALTAEVKTYAAYRAGECYGWIVSSPDDEHLDSCWGYIGDDETPYMREQANESAEMHAAQERERQAAYEIASDIFNAAA